MGAEVEACFSDMPPPCVYRCPAGLDVVGLKERIAKKKFAAAYRLLKEQLLFPGIVCHICERPCESVCLRSESGGAVRLGLLEKAAVTYGASAPSQHYRVTKQGKRVAVIGGGLSGASCASVLGGFGYDVTVFEKGIKLGGRLAASLNEEDYLPELEAGLAQHDCAVKYVYEVKDAAEFASYDAVVVCTGGENGMARGLGGDGIFSCIPHDGDPAVRAIADAVRTAREVQTYIKVGKMPESCAGAAEDGGEPDSEPAYFGALRELYAGAPPAVRAEESGDGLTEEEAATEAEACYACSCDACRRACEYMRFYKQLPKKLLENVRMNLNPMEGMKAHVATRMVFSCNACGRCGDACPEGIDMGEVMLFARSLMQRENDVPPVFHDFWMRDLAHANGAEAFLLRHAPGRQSSRRIFFPGCQLGAAAPELVKGAYAELLKTEPETGLMLGCCGAVALWAGHGKAYDEATSSVRKAWDDMGRPEFILACPSCEKVFARSLPEIGAVSLYSVLAGGRTGGAPEHGAADLPERGAGDTPAYAVFDPCATQADAAARTGVRDLLEAAGLPYGGFPGREQTNGCCGFGGLIYPANPELADGIAAARAAAAESPVVTYCINCRDVFRRNGKDCRHILEVVPGPEREDALYVPSLTERRLNREKLKEELMQELWSETAPSPSFTERVAGRMQLTFADGLRGKMDGLLLLESDVAAVIEKAESDGCVIEDRETGSLTAHAVTGLVTSWVTWQAVGGSRHVENVWCHRMSLRDEV
jgi:Fe-S oxidoreductase